jgi:hypothetical protein
VSHHLKNLSFLYGFYDFRCLFLQSPFDGTAAFDYIDSIFRMLIVRGKLRTYPNITLRFLDGAASPLHPKTASNNFRIDI